MKLQRHNDSRGPLSLSVLLVGLVVAALTALPAQAQLGADCTASLLGRTAQVNDDGSFFIANIPVEPGLHRVRVTCSPDGGVVARGQSDLFDIQPSVLILVGPIAFGTVDPIPVALDVDAPTATLAQAQEDVQLTVTGILADGSLVDMTAASGGTVYTSSDPRVAEVSANGLVTALERGAVIVSVRREGVVGSIPIEVAIPNDADGDGMTDEFEVANGTDPLVPNATTTLTGQVQDDSGAVVEGAAAVALGRITATTGQSGRFTLLDTNVSAFSPGCLLTRSSWS